MTTRRGFAAIVAMPLLIGALSGAGSNPAMTYHGVFDSYTREGSGCHLPDPTQGHVLTGVWNVQIPDPAGSRALAEVLIHLDGGMVTRGNILPPLVLQAAPTESSFDGVQVNPGETLEFALEGDQMVFSVDLPTCHIHFMGHPRH